MCVFFCLVCLTASNKLPIVACAELFIVCCTTHMCLTYYVNWKKDKGIEQLIYNCNYFLWFFFKYLNYILNLQQNLWTEITIYINVG